MVHPCTLTSRCLPLNSLQKWKAAADTACPLPPGLHYSANVAMWSVLASTLYAADPRKADQQGGLHVNVVVDVRDGRCDNEVRYLVHVYPCWWLHDNLAVARHHIPRESAHPSSSHLRRFLETGIQVV
jgi:hypothetical protein